MAERQCILVSACLIGEPCRYDGKSQPCARVKELASRFELVPVCPEQLGGLPTPRTPSEIQRDGSVKTRTGDDRTEAFCRGAESAVEIALENNCTHAVLKSKSPSCGVHNVYDGTFSGTVVAGQGIAAGKLHDAGIIVLDENDSFTVL